MRAPTQHTVPRKSFRERQFEAREEAILEATNRLLATKGYDTMVMDDIASEVGIAKGSLYKHFASKEALAASVMIRLLRATRDQIASQPQERTAIERIEAVLDWTFRERLAGNIPHLPSTSEALREHLTRDPSYLDELMALSDEIGALIAQARDEGAINPGLSDSFILYALYARSCDPTLDFLRDGGAMDADEIVQQMLVSTLNGLRPGAGAAGA